MKKYLIIFGIFIIAVMVIISGRFFLNGQNTAKENEVIKKESKRPEFVRGIHFSAWVAGSKKLRAPLIQLLEETELNTAVIAIKEYKGEVYIPGIKEVEELGNFVNAIPDLQDLIKELKSKGIFTSARIVVFKDDSTANKRPHMAVKNPDGSIWADRRGVSWLDPYHKDAWDYNLKIAVRAAELGFDEIQFDYIRFPSDGNTRLCRYSVTHTSVSAITALQGFLKEAKNRLKPYGVDISICVFGLTTTATHDLGIGQRIIEMSEVVDAVCPMVYPSHYNPGEYGILNPNAEPYKTVYISISRAAQRLGEMNKKLRPYLQDFSLGYKYGPKEVRSQIQACYDAGVYQWLLWDPRCKYTKDALLSKEEYKLFVSSVTKNKSPDRK